MTSPNLKQKETYGWCTLPSWCDAQKEDSEESQWVGVDGEKTRRGYRGGGSSLRREKVLVAVVKTRKEERARCSLRDQVFNHDVHNESPSLLQSWMTIRELHQETRAKIKKFAKILFSIVFKAKKLRLVISVS